MFEKVNPSHPDKIADRIAGAIVDKAYSYKDDPKVACEVLIGHNVCHIINETDTSLSKGEVEEIVHRMNGCKDAAVDYLEVQQDTHLADNQKDKMRCGDNGIFKAVRVQKDEKKLTEIVKHIYSHIISTDGKYLIDDNGHITACQSNIENNDKEFNSFLHLFDEKALINPLGFWTGGINVDTGATNRKLGSDMGQSITGGGLHGKDLSKADVSINIFLSSLVSHHGLLEAWAKCNIGDERVGVYMLTDDKKCIEKFYDYKYIVQDARDYIKSRGGFEEFAEWGLIR